MLSFPLIILQCAKHRALWKGARIMTLEPQTREFCYESGKKWQITNHWNKKKTLSVFDFIWLEWCAIHFIVHMLAKTRKTHNLNFFGVFSPFFDIFESGNHFCSQINQHICCGLWSYDVHRNGHHVWHKHTQASKPYDCPSLVDCMSQRESVEFSCSKDKSIFGIDRTVLCFFCGYSQLWRPSKM